MNIKLLCSDIDGTLINKDRVITPYTQQMIKRAHEEYDIPFALISGRFRGGLIPIEEMVGFPCIRACFNGAYIEYEGKVINDQPITKEVLMRSYEILKDFNVVPVLFDKEQFYMEQHGPCYEVQKSWSGKCGVVAPFKELVNSYTHYKMITRTKDPEENLRLEKTMKEANIPDLDVFRSSPYILEFVQAGVDKANALSSMMNHLNITRDNVMAFGDFNNDKNMLSLARFGIAMGNALEDVKKIAFATTATCDEDGIGKAISKYIFNEY